MLNLIYTNNMRTKKTCRSNI